MEYMNAVMAMQKMTSAIIIISEWFNLNFNSSKCQLRFCWHDIEHGYGRCQTVLCHIVKYPFTLVSPSNSFLHSYDVTAAITS